MKNKNMYDLARITKIYKDGKCFYIKASFDNTYHCEKITLEEASQLEVGQHVKIKWWWNANGYGISSRLIKPIQVLQETKEKFKTIK